MEAVKVNARIKLRNILFCTDLSEAATNALPYAAKLASHFGSKLYALNVRNTGHYAHGAPRQAPVLADLPEARAQEQIKHSLAGFSGFGHDTLIVEGELWRSISATINEKQIDLLVLGTRGRTGISKLLLGSARKKSSAVRHARYSRWARRHHCSLREPGNSRKFSTQLTSRRNRWRQPLTLFRSPKSTKHS